MFQSMIVDSFQSVYFILHTPVTHLAVVDTLKHPVEKLIGLEGRMPVSSSFLAQPVAPWPTAPSSLPHSDSSLLPSPSREVLASSTLPIIPDSRVLIASSIVTWPCTSYFPTTMPMPMPMNLQEKQANMLVLPSPSSF